MKICVLLTCHNRKAKTEKCLRSLKDALTLYNKGTEEKIQIEIYLTDDGCTDGTSAVAQSVFNDESVLHILYGDGNLFWAGGMRFCWREAMKRHEEWDYYLLLNDDTELMNNVFHELLFAEQWSVKQFNKDGIISGITCSTGDNTVLTYGGDIITNRFLSIKKRLAPIGMPQLCDKTNANILLVPTTVVDKIGIFYDGYTHGIADTDYSINARRKGIPVVLTSNFCGKCDKDHDDEVEVARKITSMSYKERIAYFNHPLHSTKDFLIGIRRTAPLRLPMVWLGRMLNICFPKLYYTIKRVHY